MHGLTSRLHAVHRGRFTGTTTQSIQNAAPSTDPFSNPGSLVDRPHCPDGEQQTRGWTTGAWSCVPIHGGDESGGAFVYGSKSRALRAGVRRLAQVADVISDDEGLESDSSDDVGNDDEDYGR